MERHEQISVEDMQMVEMYHGQTQGGSCLLERDMLQIREFHDYWQRHGQIRED